MTFEEAASRCHVRSAIYRIGDPTKICTEEDLAKVHPAMRDLNAEKVGKVVPKVYWKNHEAPLAERVPVEDQGHDDWEEYDPREQPECSAFGEAPA